MLRIVGPEPIVQSAGARIGAIIAPSTTIDLFVLGLTIFLGGVVGVLVRMVRGRLQDL
jgi:putative transport protein